MASVLEEIMRDGLVRAENGEILRLHSQIPSEAGAFLQGIIADIRPQVTLEVGLAYGISALFICEALRQAGGGRHIIIDPYQAGEDWQAVGLKNLRDAGYGELIEFHDLPSHLALPRLEAQKCTVDFAFIDGMHTFDYALIDFFHIDRILRVGGVVVLDDANMPSVRKVCRFIATNRSYTVFRCLIPGDYKVGPKDRCVRAVRQLLGTAARVLKPELAHPDAELGLIPGSRCIAFKKEAEDTRGWDFHRGF